MELNVLHTEKGVRYLTSPKEFEATYLAVRKKENRVFTDAQVSQLPSIAKEHALSKEWKLREKSVARFQNYLNENSFKTALDIGCGNGWFTNIVSPGVSEQTIGLDINQQELEQATRLFANEKTSFCYGELRDGTLPDNAFDLITLNACIQYFDDFAGTISLLLDSLTANGEIHILDSPFYAEEQLSEAQERSEEYYTKLGFPAMAQNYFHHPESVLNIFNVATLYKPNKLSLRLLKNDIPFPWLRIKK